MEDTNKIKNGVEIIKESWNEFKPRILHYVLLSSIAAAGSALYLLLLFFPTSPARVFLFKILFILFSVLSALFSSFSWASIITYTKNGDGNIKRAIRESWRKFFKLFLLFLALGIISGLGYLFLIFPGFILGIYLIFAPFILMSEDSGILESVGRSFKTSRGYWFTIFARMLVIAALGVAVYSPLAFFSMGLGGFGKELADTGNSLITFIYGFYNFVVSLVMPPFLAIYAYRLYKEISLKKNADSSTKDGMVAWKKIVLGIIVAACGLFILSIIFLGLIILKNNPPYVAGADNFSGDGSISPADYAADFVKNLPKNLYDLPEEQRKQIEEYAASLRMDPASLLDTLNEAAAKQFLNSSE